MPQTQEKYHSMRTDDCLSRAQPRGNRRFIKQKIEMIDNRIDFNRRKNYVRTSDTKKL